jgi:hypothetical protein
LTSVQDLPEETWLFLLDSRYCQTDQLSAKAWQEWRRTSMYEPHQWYDLGLLRSPGWVRLALEMRVGWEYGASIAATPLLSLAPRGDGHPVLVFPGLITGDLSTLPLRNYLESRGYAVYPWGQGINRGPREGVINACLDLLDRLSRDPPVWLSVCAVFVPGGAPHWACPLYLFL